MITLHHADYKVALEDLGQFRMIFADPPDNIDRKYRGFVDKMSRDDYQDFLYDVMSAMVEFSPISWLSFNAKWYYEVCQGLCGLPSDLDHRFFAQTFTFGTNQRKDFVNGYRPLLRLMWPGTKTYPKKVYVPSWRQEHGDPRAAKGGRMPDDTWDFPRVTGNSKQRRSWSDNQLHEGLYQRVIDFSCQRGSRICDLFAGSGTMARVAWQTHDCHLIELSDETVANIWNEHKCDLYCYKEGCEVCV